MDSARVSHRPPRREGTYGTKVAAVEPGGAEFIPLTEETGLRARSLRLLGVYDTPGRDPRGWTVSIVYHAAVQAQEAVSGADDARDARWFPANSLPKLAFDHATIVEDALERARLERRQR